MEDLEVEKKPNNIPASSYNSVWPSVKPFVNGGLAVTLQMGTAYFMRSYRFNPTAKSSPQYIHQQHLYASQRKPLSLFPTVINAATLLGSYELLTRKVEALNQGSQLTLFQEVGCGLTAAAIGVCSSYPLRGPLGAGIAHGPTNKYYHFRHIFSTITQLARHEGVLALWKGAFPLVMPIAIATDTGMIVSYDRSRVYLKETYGLREGDARLGAGLFSGLCAGACYTSVIYAAAIIRKVQSQKFKFPIGLHYALRALKPGGGFNFYSRLGMECAFRSPGIMVMWMLLETIRDAEEATGL